LIADPQETPSGNVNIYESSMRPSPLPVLRIPARLLAALLLGVAAPGPAPAQDAASRRLDGDGALALFQKYCFDCHGDGAKKGDLDLDGLLQAGRVPGARDGAEWLRAWKIVRHEFMPPAGKAKPSADERRALVDWIAAARLGVDFDTPDPGRVTLRRLNRMEYENSVQDLFAVRFSDEQDYSSDAGEVGSGSLRLRDRLPPDETAFGFDNIGDFLSLPPALLERFMEIAELVVQRVIAFDGPRSPERSFAADRFAVAAPADGPRSVQTLAFDVDEPGTYRVEIRFRVGGWQEYGGAYDVRADVDSGEVGASRIEVGGYKSHALSASLPLAPGRRVLTVTTEPKAADAQGRRKRLELRPVARVVGPLDKAHLRYPEAHRRIFFRGDAPVDPDARMAYAREILERLASRAYRRPVDPASLSGLVGLVERGATFERGIAQAVTAILSSPRFLFRAETQPRPDDPASVHPLDEYALASRLSYLLWLSLPDEELTRLAAEGRLRENLRPQLVRMLADPKSERFFEDFPGQWLRTRNVLMTPVSTKAAAKLNPVRASMKRETELLFEHVAREDRDLVELLTADYTYVDKGLADYYGLPGVPEQGFHRVALGPGSRRGGLLGQGSFLVSTSNPNRTSPVKRGVFVLENLLGVEVPPPPPNVPALDDVNLGDTSKKTGRELLALHRADRSCAACHAHFDPIGIALEHFDLIGRWRDDEEGRPIDSAERAMTGEKVAGLDDVRGLLVRQKSRLYRGITEKLMTYALGRGLEPSDSPAAERIADAVEASGGKFSALLTGLVESRAFQMRRGDAGGSAAALRSSLPTPPPPGKRRPARKPEPKTPVPAENVIPVEPDEKKPKEANR